MELFEAMARRHSYRGRLREERVPREVLARIVEAGLQAPSGRNMQTTEFVVVDDAGMLQRIGSLPGARPAIQTAPAMILCVTHREPPAVYHGMHFEVEDCAAAVENMLLAITALGYASVWIDGWLRVEGRAEQIGAWLGIPEHLQVRVLLPVGRPLEPLKGPEKKTFEQRACFNGYTLPGCRSAE